MLTFKKNNRLHSSVIVMIAAVVIMLAGSVQIYAGAEKASKKAGMFAKEFIPILQRAKTYSLEFAGAMPEEHYKFKPTPEIMSFGEQIVHTAGATFWFISKITGEENPGKGFKAEGKSKDEIMKFLEKSFAYAEKALADLSDKDAVEVIHLFGELKLTKSQTFQTIRDHVTHHRGGMVIYLRLKGIKPPEYVGW